MISPLPTGLLFLRRSGFHFFLLIVVLISLSGCAGRLNKAVDHYYSGDPQKALQILNKGDHFGNRSQLLFLLEKGLVLHQLGEYQESTDQLLEAAQLIDQFELISVSEQTASLVTSEWMIRYKGEYSERLWVHSYLMMNYLLLGQYDDALVEAKQALERLDKYPQALTNAYFSRALIALCFANLAEDNDAYLVYRKLADDLPSSVPVAADIIRHAERLGMIDEVEKYQPFLPLRLPEGESELVRFVANGQIPVKRPGNVFLPPSIRFAFPYYSGETTPRARIKVLPRRWIPLPLLSTDLGDVARTTLAARKVRIITKETLRVATKEAIAQSVGNKNDVATEAIVRVALFLLEEPDTRSWQTLPGRLTLVRIPLPAGRHELQLELQSSAWTGKQVIDLPEFELRRGQRIFRSLRF